MGKYLLPRINPCLLLLGILHGSQIVRSLHLLLVGIGIKSRHNEGKNHYDHDDHDTHHSHLVLQQSAHSVLPEAHALPHDYLTLLLFLCCGQKILRINLQLKTDRILFHIYTHAFPA